MDTAKFPLKADILNEIYQPFPEPEASVAWNDVDKTSAAESVIERLSEALKGAEPHLVADLFLHDQSYWRDSLALTSHLRTFQGHNTIAAALTHLAQEREPSTVQAIPGSIQVQTASETLSWLDCSFTFRTSKPEALCNGRLMLLPRIEGQSIGWKIWTLTTWLGEYEKYPSDESLLKVPSKPLNRTGSLETDVLIVGGGNAGIILGARLKTLGVNYLIIDKNENIGDNWALRYDCLRFHVGKSFCETPYLPYPSDASDGLTRDELANHIRWFALAFDIQVLHRTTVASTEFDAEKKSWTLQLLVGPDQSMTVTGKHLVLATGVGFAGACIPDIPGAELYQGWQKHSDEFKNALALADEGIKSALVIGSANTAFDIMEDCYNAGLETTMIQRSPTYVVPMPYLQHPQGLGIFDYVATNAADAMLNVAPLAVGGPLLGNLHARLAAAEPERYAELAKAGFQVTDSTQSDLIAHLLDRCGGHFVEIGTGLELLATKKVGIKSGVSPRAYTATGLEFTDGSTQDADAIIWCTGFKTIDVREGLPDILGAGAEAIAQKMEPTWGVDSEGEVRGLWRRQAQVDNFWVFGGGTAQHRWYSNVIALQIKAALEGILPEAYTATPAMA